MMEGRLSLGHEVCMDQYGRLAGHLRRILETLGVERKQRPADRPLSLEEISAHINAQSQQEGS
jgi:hypothetical protein